MADFSTKLCDTNHNTSNKQKKKNEDADETITSENVFQSKHQSSLFWFTVISLKNILSAASNSKIMENFFNIIQILSNYWTHNTFCLSICC